MIENLLKIFPRVKLKEGGCVGLMISPPVSDKDTCTIYWGVSYSQTIITNNIRMKDLEIINRG